MKTHFHKLPIGKKLRALILLAVGLITLLTIIILCFYMYGNLRDDFRNDSKVISGLMAENVASALLFDDKKTAREAFAGLRTVKEVTHAELYDKAGNLFASYDNGTGRTDPPARFDPSEYQQDIRFGLLTFARAFPVQGLAPDEGPIGTITMQMDLSGAYVQLGYHVATLLVLGLLCAALVSAVLSKLLEKITLPLLSLTQTMRKVSKDSDFSERAILSSQDEIGELASVFNQMIDELSHREFSLHQELKERRRIETRLSQIAHFDAVTHLPNRHSFNGQIDKALLNYKYDRERFALIYLDLDNFKYVNDTFGHHVGDLMLAKVAERLRKSLRQEDFIARMGGDEFVIIMRDFTDNAQVSAATGKVLATLQAPFILDHHEVFISASIGITTCPENGEDCETLQRQADNAMYQAKKRGKNNFQFYQPEWSFASENRINIEAQLRRSLEHNEIVVHYQPIMELDGERIVGFEALVRWVRPDGTIIRPDAFIPLAEEIGLIIDIGQFVINTSATQTAAWVERFGPIFTAVNFSSRQFKHTSIADDIINALRHAHLDPGNFELEITESVLMDNTIDSLNLLGKLIGQGMGIAIDDFGTGYSSLSYITSFPISKIKIDKSFVANLPDDKNALAVVTAIIGLAGSLNLKVVAEGIETAEQLACLARLGCKYGQGFLFSPPVPASQATNLLELRHFRAGQSSKLSG